MKSIFKTNYTRDEFLNVTGFRVDYSIKPKSNRKCIFGEEEWWPSHRTLVIYSGTSTCSDLTISRRTPQQSLKNHRISQQSLKNHSSAFCIHAINKKHLLNVLQVPPIPLAIKESVCSVYPCQVQQKFTAGAFRCQAHIAKEAKINK